MADLREARGLNLGDFAFGDHCMLACVDWNCLRVRRCKWSVLAERAMDAELLEEKKG